MAASGSSASEPKVLPCARGAFPGVALWPRVSGESRSLAGQAASVPGSVKASRWSPKSTMISRRPPRASTGGEGAQLGGAWLGVLDGGHGALGDAHAGSDLGPGGAEARRISASRKARLLSLRHVRRRRQGLPLGASMEETCASARVISLLLASPDDRAIRAPHTLWFVDVSIHALSAFFDSFRRFASFRNR